MREISEYLDLRYELYLSNYRLDPMTNEGNNLEGEHKSNQELKDKIDLWKAKLSEPNVEADKIRAGLIYVMNGFIAGFKKIADWGQYYPDLGQGMIIPGYLLGMLIEDLRWALRTEGDYNPVSHIYMSPDQWDYKQLESLLEKSIYELKESSFKSKLEAIDYFDNVSNSIHKLIEKLRAEGVI